VNALAFALPAALEAREPPEARGVARDGVRLLVAGAAGGQVQIEHRVFSELPELLRAGDLLVVNVSATLPAALRGRRADGSPVRIHFSTRAPRLEASWRVVELRSPDGSRPDRGAAGELIDLEGGASLELVAPYASGARLLLARYRGRDALELHLARHGEPIRYGYVGRGWPLRSYQNVYARTPGSAEMPSAGRPFTPELITGLVAAGVSIAPITLHCGVSSPERHELPFPEWYEVPVPTARLVNSTREWGGRVIAVGTTVVRALESVQTSRGETESGSGWTGVVITRERPPRSVDGIITGWHEPEASHLQMLEALGGRELVARSYEAALEHHYLWHEFGDSHLILRG
jgi:S-adenosylmethionine:tRNA ribosyltransferase-isomerase